MSLKDNLSPDPNIGFSVQQDDTYPGIVPNADGLLWRYMDLSKYMSLLLSKSVWFSAADLLGDPYEGSMPRANLPIRIPLHIDSGIPEDQLSDFLAALLSMRQQMPKHVYVSCWHSCEYESAAMWEVYGRESGIAVLSSYSRMCRGLGGADPIVVRAVDYIDYNVTSIDEDNAL